MFSIHKLICFQMVYCRIAALQYLVFISDYILAAYTFARILQNNLVEFFIYQYHFS